MELKKLKQEEFNEFNEFNEYKVYINFFNIYNFITFSISFFLNINDNISLSMINKETNIEYKNDIWKHIAISLNILKSDTNQNGLIECLFYKSKLNTNAKKNFIYKTDAIRDYLLNLEELTPFMFEVSNPYPRRNYVICHKISIEKCIELSFIKYDGYNNLKQTKIDLYNKSREKYIKKLDAKIEKEIYRETQLKKALKKVGLELRDDSNLCKKYIECGVFNERNYDDEYEVISSQNSSRWTMKKIVNRMCQMKYLYDYANMNKALKKADKEYIDTLKSGYFPDVPVFEMAEMIALEKTRGIYPTNWPWLK